MSHTNGVIPARYGKIVDLELENHLLKAKITYLEGKYNSILSELENIPEAIMDYGRVSLEYEDKNLRKNKTLELVSRELEQKACSSSLDRKYNNIALQSMLRKCLKEFRKIEPNKSIKLSEGLVLEIEDVLVNHAEEQE